MDRELFLLKVEAAYQVNKVVAILGPRQCGKTTLARHYFQKNNGDRVNYFDLEDPIDLLRLSDPMLALRPLRGLIVIDEVQRHPELFPILRVLVDDTDLEQQYLILGSASRELIKQSSESLAGRISYLELTPFMANEVGDLDKLWLRGGFPVSYLASEENASMQWRKDYIRTYLEQDIPNLGINIEAEKLRRFWMILSHYHGQLFNASEIANAMDISHPTAQRYLDILTGTFMVRQLAPWYENIAKRQVKSKKIYLRDSGILHALLNINNKKELLVHPKIGASWEGFALESVIQGLNVDRYDCYFWAIHNQAELDLLIVQGSKRLGFEFKFSQVPKVTTSMQIAIKELQLDILTVIYPGDKTFYLQANIICMGLQEFIKGIS